MTDQTNEALPAGITQEQNAACAQLIVDGYADNKTPADIKDELFSTGIGYTAVAKVFKAITESKNLVVTVASLKESFEALVKNDDFTFDAWAEVTSYVDGIAGKIPGATSSQILKLLRSKAKEFESVLPEKPKAARKAGNIASGAKAACAAAFIANPLMTQEEMRQAILPGCKADWNAFMTTKSLYVMCYMMMNNVDSVPEANMNIKPYVKPEDDAEGVAVEAAE